MTFNAGSTCKNGHLLSVESTYVNPAGYAVCKMCRRSHTHKYSKTEKGRHAIRGVELKRHFWSREKEAQALTEQNNCCAICFEVFSEVPHADHDHDTKEPRGLLCNGCNVALGHFKDSSRILESATAYLRKYGK